MEFHGRDMIVTDIREVTAENVATLISQTRPTFLKNKGEIEYLYDYYCGKQPILLREKDVRPEICNRIVENHAQECVYFKVGYQLSEPIQYISRPGKEDVGLSVRIANLNDMMYSEDKASADHDLFEWCCIAGLGYRFVNADKEHAPFEFYTVDPRCAYVVHTSDFRHKPLAGVVVTYDHFVDGTEIVPETYDVYTENKHFIVSKGGIIEEDNYLGIPLIEYDLNNARMGVFEPALAILDAINLTASDRMDGIEQTIQSLMKFVNCDINEDDFNALRALGAVKINSVDGQAADVDFISNDLDQSQTQISKDDLYQSFLDIVGMPNRNVGSGASDTGKAVLLRDGWTLAESHAKSYELQFKKAERRFLNVVLKICDWTGHSTGLDISDIDMAFNRRNYDNNLTKSQVLTTMLDNGQIHPLLAFQSCGMFTDPEAAYLASEAYIASTYVEAKEEE